MRLRTSTLLSRWIRGKGFEGYGRHCLRVGHFDEGKIEHRIYLKAPSAREEIPVDLIPFGEVAQDDVIRWPPNREMIMTVAGFEDAIAVRSPGAGKC